MLMVPFHNLSWFSIQLNGDPEKNQILLCLLKSRDGAQLVFVLSTFLYFLFLQQWASSFFYARTLIEHYKIPDFLCYDLLLSTQHTTFAHF